MIQRIQTIYLLLISILIALVPFFYLALFKIDGELIYTYSIYKIVPQDGGDIIIPGNWIPQIVLLSAILIVSIITLFKYKNRKLQLKLGTLNYLFMATFIISTYLSVMNISSLLELGEEVKTIYYVGFYLPIAAITFQFLANRAIKKDEELVKSVERLRR
jgi:hypothetical protein